MNNLTVKDLINKLALFNPNSSIDIVIRGKNPSEDTWTDIFNDITEEKDGGKSWIILDAQGGCNE